MSVCSDLFPEYRYGMDLDNGNGQLACPGIGTEILQALALYSLERYR